MGYIYIEDIAMGLLYVGSLFILFAAWVYSTYFFGPIGFLFFPVSLIIFGILLLIFAYHKEKRINLNV